MSSRPLTYKDAGVDIDAGDRLVQRIGPLAARTRRSEVLSGLGGFGGLFALPPGKYEEPVLVAGTDGVGTKLKLAQQLNRHESIGIDLVAMCANDVVVQGAEPLFFLDYFACGRLDVEVAATVVDGIARGCEEAGAALIGGETAEMPDMYAIGEYDLAGFCVGAVERRGLIDGRDIVAGDLVIGIASSGPHANGFSLIRRVLESVEEDSLGDPRPRYPVIDGVPAEEMLLEPTRIYVKPLLALMRKIPIKGMAHITGGGITENLPRVLPGGLHARIDVNSWRQGALFDWLAQTGGIAAEEMRRTFNCGVGMALVLAREAAETALAELGSAGETAFRMGEIAAGAGGVRYR
ncbi:MAG TPA: phosphoribosylformylglycinamidine cyclo-ligase [Woeseiaceae bacterium]|nr:phosphoribosylformylglycinamidine cyclo-ligase [Woeseiaceae bacterium]